MTRHWSAVASSFVFTAVFVTTVSAQNSPRYSNTDLRPGWKRDGLDPADARGRFTVAPTPTQLAQSSSSQGRSFLPNWFGLGGGNTQTNQQPRSPQQNSTKQSSNGQRPANGGTNSGIRPAEGMPADSMPPDPATMEDTPLPGLGGAPLPRKTSQTASGDSPNAQMSTGSPNSAAARSASRQPLTSNAATTAGDNAVNSTATPRTSPGRRTSPHISPDELRRELSGGFPTPNTSGDVAPRTAQADSSLENKSSASLGGSQPAADEGGAVISDAPMVAPESPATETAPTIQPPIVDNSKPVMPPVSTSSPAAADAFGAAQRARSAYGSNNSVRLPFNSPNSASSSHTPLPAAPANPQIGRGRDAFDDGALAAAGGDPNVLSSTQTPVITADIRGPKQIQVGREALYRVRLQNQGDLPAENIVATIRIPAGAEVRNSTATQGSVQPSQESQITGLQWHVARLDRSAGETLEIRLVPRESRPLELGVSWTAAPIASRAVVEVQEAKLQLDITGASEVLYGKPQVFKIALTNPGTGPAENVKIELLPPGGGQEAATSHTIGDLAPGASQTVEVELTPREAGKLSIRALATAEGGLNSEAAKEIFCRKPELEVDFRGPAIKYSGTLATYYIRVRNPGTAAADDVVVKATVPDGAEFVSASDGQSYDAQNREVAWRVGTLSPGDDNFLELKCTLKAPGTNRVKIVASSGAGDLADSKVAETNVQAIADLKLDVIDPTGPVAVGTQAVYEIHVHNRGASAAKDVNVVALFSEGIEPEQAEGAMYTIADGRVTFRTIEDLSAGRDLVLRIRAHATQPGTHVFRAEVLCKELDIKLAAEETTRFYADDVRADAAEAEGKSASRSEMFQPAVK